MAAPLQVHPPIDLQSTVIHVLISSGPIEGIDWVPHRIPPLHCTIATRLAAMEVDSFTPWMDLPCSRRGYADALLPTCATSIQHRAEGRGPRHGRAEGPRRRRHMSCCTAVADVPRMVRVRLIPGVACHKSGHCLGTSVYGCHSPAI